VRATPIPLPPLASSTDLPSITIIRNCAWVVFPSSCIFVVSLETGRLAQAFAFSFVKRSGATAGASAKRVRSVPTSSSLLSDGSETSTASQATTSLSVTSRPAPASHLPPFTELFFGTLSSAPKIVSVVESPLAVSSPRLRRTRSEDAVAEPTSASVDSSPSSFTSSQLLKDVAEVLLLDEANNVFHLVHFAHRILHSE